MRICRLSAFIPIIICAGMLGCGNSPVDDDGETSGTFTVYSETGGLINNDVNDIAVDLSRSGVWIATSAGVSLYSLVDSSWISYGALSDLPSLEVNSLLANLGVVWAGTASGVASLRDSTWNELPDPGVLPNPYVTVIASTSEPDYILWFGTSGGVARRSFNGTFTGYDAQNGLAADDVTAISRDSGGNIWVGTSSTLNVFDGSVWDVPDAPLSNVFIRTIYADASGSVWVGTSGGVMEFDGSARRTYGTANGLPSAVVNDFVEDFDLTLWAATDEGIAWLDGTVWRELSLPDAVSGRPVTSLASDVLTRSLWIGTTGGLVRYQPDI